jgi:hypothetical protein
MTQISLTQRVGLEARNVIIRRKYAEGVTIPELVKEFELSARHLKVYIIGFNREPTYRRLTSEGKMLLIQMWEAEESLSAIAKACKIDISKVKKWRQRYGLAPRATGNPFGRAGRPPHFPHPDSY